MEAPSMVHRSGNTLIVRSVVSGNPLFVDSGNGNLQKTSSQIFANNSNTSDNAAYNNRSLRIDYDAVASPIPVDDYDNQIALSETKDEGLPQCKIKRNYSCSTCSFFTQNPRHFLMHLRDSHGEKIVINECKLCLYASRHYQKLVRHMKMVHGSTEGIEEHSQARKRQLGREQRKRKIELENVHTQSTPASPQIMHPLDRYEEPISVPDETPQNRLLKCSVCEFTTLYRAQLVDHEQEEHYKTKFFRCEKCSYVTHIKARFSKHVKYHSMPMIKCVTCDFRTPYKWNLDRHMKNHGGTGPYKCAACNFTADIKQSLTVHEMNHHVPPVGHAAGMSMARRKNKVGATDIPEELLSENGDLSDAYNNNNNVMESFEEPYNKKLKIEEDDQPTDLSQKSSMESLKKQARPIPNLIPIQAANNALNLTKTFYEMLSKSYMSNNMYMYSEAALDGVEPPHLSPSSSASSSNSKKKSHNESLASECNYMSRYASEAIHHQKTRCRDDLDKVSSPSPINLSVNGSTRCQHCRHRCKSSNDLIAHLKNCPDAGRMGNESLDSLSDSHEKNDELNEDMNERSPPPGEKHPMENKVFVWNNLPQRVDTEHIDENEEEKLLDESNKSMDGLSEDQKKENSENSYYGVETAPGYGEVTKKMTPEEEAANSSLKKVYKCPHCSFWASTASRFHVHIVGHLNKKPFECSLCNYRSNWRWDITKHIRLKTIRDPNHKNAKVLMNDETGRRNYTKYNKYITLMKVTEEDGDPKLMKSGEMTPNQEATLSFLNGYKQESEEFNGGHSEAGSSKNMSALDISRMMQMSFFQNPLLALAPEQAKRSPSPLIKPSEDIVTQNIEMKADGTDKRTLYKCRKCDYKNASREMVLSHVKRHYQEAGINFNAADFLSMPPHLQAVVNSSNYMKNVVAAMCLSQQQQLASVSGGDPNSFQNPHSMLATASLATNTGPKVPPIGNHPNIIPSTSHQSLNLISPSNQRLQHQQEHQQLPVSVNHSNNNSSSSNQIHRNLSNSASGAMAPSSSSPLAAVGTSSTTVSATITGNICSTTPTAITNNNQSGLAPNNEHGEAEEASSGVVTTGTGVTGWRGPAPYRCGHCHQVSNWKHVIQRHCRLKHNGDIRIETIDRNSDKDMPVYYPLNSQPPTQAPLPSPFNNSSSNVSSTVPGLGLIGSKPSTSGLAVAKNLTIGSSAQSSIPPTSDLHNHKIFGGSFIGGLASNHIEGGGIRDEHDGGSAAGGGTKPRQQQCPLCPFVSESKSQMMYHNSLHKCKSDFYQCQICDFNCSKKQLFNQHMKISHDHKPDVEIDLSASNENLAATQALSFCPRCPARYIGSKELNLHLKMHTAKYSHRCGLCSYTALQEPSLLTHSTVHSMSYDEKTVNMLKKFVEDVHYPRPKLTMISLSSGDQVFVVERNTDPDFGDPMKTASVEETAGVDQKPSLLKQQLESNGSDSSSHGPDYPDELPAKKCPQCPFETTRGSADLKSHMNHHIAVSQKRHPATCLHCDFSVSDEQSLKDHVVLHFKSIKNNDVAFYTSYENVELNLVNDDDDEEGGDGNNGERKSNCRGSAGDARSKKIIIFKGDDVKVNGLSEQQSSTKCTKGNGDGDNSSRLKTEDSSDIDDKKIVVATTGELIKIRSTSNM